MGNKIINQKFAIIAGVILAGLMYGVKSIAGLDNSVALNVVYKVLYCQAIMMMMFANYKHATRLVAIK